MADKIVVETIYGKFSKYEIVKDLGDAFSGPKFYIYQDGKYHRGSFPSLREAVETAKTDAEKGG
jgi:hypothetical protein